MSNPYLPPEILDHVVDLLHNEPEALKQCCLVSKSWVPRIRRHLFAYIKFHSADDLGSWKRTFLDVANSPAYHAHTLFVGCPSLVTPSDAKEGGWIRAFSGAAALEVDGGAQYLRASEVSLTPFYKFSPTLKSPRIQYIAFPYQQVFNLILSFPLLEDLTLKGYYESWARDRDPRGPQTAILSSSPALTGSLNFHVRGGAGNTARQLLELPNGLHFRKLALSWDLVEDLQWIMELVEKCSHALESLDIIHHFHPLGLEQDPPNLSKATKLRDVVFRPASQSVGWITMALQTITSEHRDFRQISIYVPSTMTFFKVGADIGQSIGEAISRRWSDLDRFLVEFLESRSIRLRVGCARSGERGQNTEYCIACLLPEITKRGIAEPI